MGVTCRLYLFLETCRRNLEHNRHRNSPAQSSVGRPAGLNIFSQPMEGKGK